MAQAALKKIGPVAVLAGPEKPALCRSAGADKLAPITVKTQLVADLSRDLHGLFDHVSDDPLPIYFGPLLGRLYLEGL